MSHVSDFTQEGDKIVLDLINEDNNSALALTVVSVALASEGVPATKNTLVTVTPLPGSGYSGSMNLEYNRLAISDFVDLYYPEGLIIPQGNGENLYDFLPEINAALAVNLTAADLADQPLAAWTGVPNESQEVNAAILAGSLVYTGNLTFIVNANDIPLTSIITTLVLDGLNLPVGEDRVEVEYYSGQVVSNTFTSNAEGWVGATAYSTGIYIDGLIDLSLQFRFKDGVWGLFIVIDSYEEDNTQLDWFVKNITSIELSSSAGSSVIDGEIIEALNNSEYINTYPVEGLWHIGFSHILDGSSTIPLPMTNSPVDIVIKGWRDDREV